MAESTTLNVRMDADTKDAFISFCDAIGISASSLMNVFAKTVVRNQEVPFPLTTRTHANAIGHYARVFPRNAEELERMLADSESTPLAECAPMVDAAALMREHMGW
ncbi:MAG: type II toxin-antitoxin system RelB/DinJ family antitoxin [Eggerthellaceae bacterium]|nr:type II toxin-antitoxin system RelB/DinJ family antitoxin [Eggerthellaceae bacterium]